MPAPTGLVVNEIGVMGHSNTGTFIDGYRSISSRDLLPPINHGSYDAETWGDPANGSYTAAWNKLDDDEPVGGFRAFWVMLGFRNTNTNLVTNHGWVDHIGGRLHTDFPDLEWVWWSPMNTYFATNPGDGDAASLIALDPWDTNPQSLSTWRGIGDMDSEMSFESAQYAVAQGYANQLGPWINLTDALTDTDDRHPTETSPPNGQTHGADILKAFFDVVVTARSMGGTVRTGTLG